MFPWRKLCCPVDFTELSRAALEQAARLAAELGAELILVYVRPRPRLAAAPLAPPAPVDRSAAADAERLAACVHEAERLAPGRVTSVELSGPPPEKIVELASEFGCDVIVLATHARGGLAHLAVGSVAYEVLRAARCPVLVVPAAAGAQGAAAGRGGTR